MSEEREELCFCVNLQFLYNGSKEIPTEIEIPLRAEIRRMEAEFGEVDCWEWFVDSSILLDFLREIVLKFPGLSVICLPDKGQECEVDFV